MIEQILRFDSTDGHGIYGKLRHAHPQEKSDKLILHIHGMTHSMNHMLEVMAADYFTAQGYDHYRINLYGREKDARNITQSSISTHLDDISRALAYFQDRYEHIYITAHSLGALCMLILNPPNIKAMSLWDPSTDVSHFWDVTDALTHMPDAQAYQMDYGNVFLIGEQMVDEIKTYTDAECLRRAADITTPVQFIIPTQSIFLASPHAAPENYKAAFGGPFTLTQIDKANHTFSDIGNQRALLDKTRGWLQQH